MFRTHSKFKMGIPGFTGTCGCCGSNSPPEKSNFNCYRRSIRRWPGHWLFLVACYRRTSVPSCWGRCTAGAELAMGQALTRHQNLLVVWSGRSQNSKKWVNCQPVSILFSSAYFHFFSLTWRAEQQSLEELWLLWAWRRILSPAHTLACSTPGLSAWLAWLFTKFILGLCSQLGRSAQNISFLI